MVSGDPVSGRSVPWASREAFRMAPESGVPRLFVLSRIDMYEHRELFQADYFLVDAATPVSAHRAACSPFDPEVFRANLEEGSILPFSTPSWRVR